MTLTAFKRQLALISVIFCIVPAYYLCCYLASIHAHRGEYEFMTRQSSIPVTLVVTKKNTTEDAASDHEDKLPSSVIDGVKTFVFFLALSHSGHSIVASLMDGHPNMVISHEFDLFNKLASKSLSPTKTEIFNALWNNTRRTIINGPRAKTATRKGYTLFIDGLYQGRYVDHIDVIGDKRGLGTIEMLLLDPNKWLSVLNTLKSLNTTLKMIHVIRNPFDNIATSVLFSSKERSIGFGDIKQSNETREVNSRIVMNEISHYFLYHEAAVNVKEKYNVDTIEIHNKDLISDPKGTLLKICNSLAVTCSNEYLEICSNKIFKSESRTRYMVKWTDRQLQSVQQNIDEYGNLKGYSFNSL